MKFKNPIMIILSMCMVLMLAFSVSASNSIDFSSETVGNGTSSSQFQVGFDISSDSDYYSFLKTDDNFKLWLTFDDLVGDNIPEDISGNGVSFADFAKSTEPTLQGDGIDDQISTGIIPDEDTTIILKGSFPSSTSLIGGNNGTDSRFYLGRSTNYWRSGFGDTYYTSSTVGDSSEHIFRMNKTGFYVDGSLELDMTSSTFGTSSMDLKLFGSHGSVSYTATDNKMSYALIYDGATLVRNFTIYNTSCLNETVNNQLYCNDGVGNFTYSPATYSEGKYGNAISFDKTYTVMSTDTSDVSIATNRLTLCAWVNQRDESMPNYAGIAGKYDSSTQNRSYLIAKANTDNRYIFSLSEDGSNGGTEFKLIRSNDELSLNEWHHVCGVYDGTTQMMYIDSILQSETSTVVDGIFETATARFEIGSFNHGDYPYSGMIDEVLVFDRVFSHDEIKSLYNSSQYSFDTELENFELGEIDFTGYSVNTQSERDATETRTFTLEERVCLKDSTYDDLTGDCEYRADIDLTLSNGKDITYYLDAPDNYNSSEEYPLIIYFHGHGTDYRIYSGDYPDEPYNTTDYYADFRTLARARGYVSISINYDSLPGAGSWMNASAILEVDEVLEDVMSMYNIDRYNINTFGKSMGGGSSLIYAIQNEDHLISAALDMQGITNYTLFYNIESSHRTSLSNALGGTPTEVPEAYYEISAVNYPESFNHFSAMLLYGGTDTTVPVEPYLNDLISVLDAEGLQEGTDYVSIIDAPQGHSYESIWNYEETAIDWFDANTLTDEKICLWDDKYWINGECSAIYTTQDEGQCNTISEQVYESFNLGIVALIVLAAVLIIGLLTSAFGSEGVCCVWYDKWSDLLK